MNYQSISIAVAAWCLVAAGPYRSDYGQMPAAARQALHAEDAKGTELINLVKEADGTFAYARVRTRNGRTLAVDASGRPSSPEAAHREFAKKHKVSHGAVGLETARRLLDKDPQQVREFIVWYSGDPANIATGIKMLDPEAIVRAKPNIILFRASAADMYSHVAFHPSAQKVIGATPAPAVQAMGPGGEPSNSFSMSTDLAFNSAGYHGNEVKIGLVDGHRYTYTTSGGNTHEAGCVLGDEHEAFGNLGGLHYMYEGASCSAIGNGSCDYKCESTAVGGSEPGVCLSTSLPSSEARCVSSHLHASASRIASRTGGVDYHASAVELFVANGYDTAGLMGGSHVARTVEDTELIYDWFLGNGVRLVVQEFYEPLQDTIGARDVVQDWFARYHKILFVDVAGNVTPDNGVRCRNFNGLCVGVANNPNWSRDPLDFVNSSFVFRNYPGLEWEKPDLVADGLSVADVYNSSGWVDRWGTSFSAPAVGGAIAQFLEYARAHGSVDGLDYPPLLRSIVRTSAWSETILDSAQFHSHDDPTCALYRYPTAQNGCDYIAGVGPLDARNLLIWTEPGDECEVFSQEEDASVVEALTPCHATSIPGQATRGGTTVLAELGDLGVGSRVRVSLSFDSCPVMEDEPSELRASVDLNVGLCGLLPPVATITGENSGWTSRCVALSRAADDTNEGFDIRLEGAMSNAKIVLFAPEIGTWSPCPDINGSAVPGEPYAWSAVWWPREFVAPEPAEPGAVPPWLDPEGYPEAPIDWDPDYELEPICWLEWPPEPRPNAALSCVE